MKQGTIRKQGFIIARFLVEERRGIPGPVGDEDERRGLKGPSFSIFNAHRSPGGLEKVPVLEKGAGWGQSLHFFCTPAQVEPLAFGFWFLYHATLLVKRHQGFLGMRSCRPGIPLVSSEIWKFVMLRKLHFKASAVLKSRTAPILPSKQHSANPSDRTCARKLSGIHNVFLNYPTTCFK